MASSAIRTYERKPGFSRNGSAKKLHNSFSGYGQESIPPERSYTSETVVDSSEIRRARSNVTTGPCVAQNFTTISADAPSDTPSEDSCSLKRKSMSLNGNRNKESLICNLPFGDLTRGQRKQLRNKLKLDLQYVRSLYMKVEAREMQIHSLLKGSAGNYRPRVNGSVSNGHYFPPAAESSYREGWNSRQMNVTIPEHSSDGLNSFGKDKRTPKANQLYASSDFVSGKDKFPSEKNKPKFLMNGKRSLQGGDEQRDLKRIKIDPSYRKKMAEFLKQCGVLLKKLMGHKFGWVFNEPVDAVKLKLDDYHFIIKKPMDLGTIKKKLESGTYSLPSEFCDDVRLTFANAMKYNPPGHDVFVMADTLRGMFERKWKTIAEKIKELDSASDRIVNMNSREALGSVEQSIAPPAAMQPLASSSKPAAPIKAKPTPVVKSAVKAKVKAPVQHRRHMTFAEKQQLSESLANLPPEKLEQAVQIMRKNPNLTQNDDEIEVDIESFDPDTLWELHKFVMDSKGSSVTEERSLEGGYERAANHQVSSSIPKTMKSNLKSNEVGEEEVDIGDDMPAKEFPPVVIEKDRVVNNKEISSSSSSSSSGSSSSDSDSASSSGSDSDADEGHSVEAASKISSADKEPVGSAAVGDQRGSLTTLDDGMKRPANKCGDDISLSKSSCPDVGSQSEGIPSTVDACHERQARAALLRSRFAETILKAQEKTLPVTKTDNPEKLRKEQEELERRRKEEKARLHAEARAVELARKKAELAAAEEAKLRREAEREAARQALQKMERTVEIDENMEVLKDLERLRSGPLEHVPSSGDETSPLHSPVPFSFEGSNALERLGLFMRNDEYEEQEEEQEVDPVLAPPNSS